jgi:hypothetical protein
VHFFTLCLAIFQICPGSIVLWTFISLPCSLLYFRFVLAVLCFGRSFLYLVPCYISDLSQQWCAVDVHFFTLFLALFQICPSSTGIVLCTCTSLSLPCSLLCFRFVLAVFPLDFGDAFLYLVPCYISDLS